MSVGRDVEVDVHPAETVEEVIPQGVCSLNIVAVSLVKFQGLGIMSGDELKGEGRGPELCFVSLVSGGWSE